MDISATDQFEILGRLALAAALGGFMGLEREMRGYPAGIRTIALVTMGACLFTDVSQLLGGNDRVAAQVVAGIGFIGAGLIFREGYTVRGITTAATIWAAAAVGMAVGLEMYIVAAAGAVIVFLVLEARPLTRRVENVIRPREQTLRQELANLLARTPDDNEHDEKGRDED